MTSTTTDTGRELDGSEELAATARQVFADHPAAADDTLAEPLWSTLTELGLTRLTLPEDAGGSGGTLADAAALLLVAGEAAAPVPLAETDLLAGWLLHAAGLEVPDGPLAAVAAGPGVTARREGDAVALSGALPRVGWARVATRIAVLVTDPDGTDLVVGLDPAGAGVDLAEGVNLAGEPRDDLTVDTTVPADRVAPAPAGAREQLTRRAALARALLLAGVAGRALARTVHYAGEREQFGRPIGRFQAVQQQLALAAGEVAAGLAAARAAAGALLDDPTSPDTGFAVAVAKARTSEAAGQVARIAHQVHGAIGFTLEHDLRRATTRLWAWREEDGDEAHWHAVIGDRVLADGPDGLWPLLTRAG